VVIAGGLNPLAALSEANIEAENKAMSTLVEFSELQPFEELFKSLF
jgi:repressor of nif and glnA expression